MTETNANTIVEKFKKKYALADISAVDIDYNDGCGTIYVHTHNPKIWVDIPEYFENFYVKMNVHRKRR